VTVRIIYPANTRFPSQRANTIQITNTCRAMAELGAEVHMIVRRMGRETDEECLAFYGLEPHENLHLHRLRVFNTHSNVWLWNRSFQLMCFLCMMRVCRRRKPTVICNREIGYATQLLKFRKLLGAKLIFETHDIGFLTIRHYDSLISTGKGFDEAHERRVHEKEAKLYAEVDGIAPITDQLERLIREEFHATQPMSVIRSGVALDTPPRRPDPSREKALVLYTGQVYLWKGVNVLVEAMKHVPDAELLVLGGLPYEDDLDRVKEFAAEQGVANRCSFPGSVPPPEVQEHLSRADAAVIPLTDTVASRYFTSPLKLFQYMASAAPIVASDLPTIRELLTHEHNALLVPPNDPAAMAQAIRRLIDDRGLAERLGAQAQADVQSFGWASRAERYLDLARRLFA